MGGRNEPPPKRKIKKKCSLLCFNIAIICSECNCYFHVKCTDLPNYQIVHWLNSRIKHRCVTCVQALYADYDKRCQAIACESQSPTVSKFQTTPQETTVIPTLTTLVPTTPSTSASTSTQPPTSTTPSAPSTSTNTITQPPTPTIPSAPPLPNSPPQTPPSPPSPNKPTSALKKICLFYSEHRCRYGKQGKLCPYAHPPVCKLYKTNGLNPTDGCKHGKNCKSYHPPLCNNSVNNRLCLNQKCPLLHLKGTKRHQQIIPSSYTNINSQNKQNSHQNRRPPLLQLPNYQNQYTSHPHYTSPPHHKSPPHHPSSPQYPPPPTNHSSHAHYLPPPPPPPQQSNTHSLNTSHFSQVQISQLRLLMMDLLKEIPWQRDPGIYQSLPPQTS